MLTLMQGDCLEKLKTIPDGTVDLVLTEERRLEGPSALEKKEGGAGRLRPGGIPWVSK